MNPLRRASLARVKKHLLEKIKGLGGVFTHDADWIPEHADGSAQAITDDGEILALRVSIRSESLSGWDSEEMLYILAHEVGHAIQYKRFDGETSISATNRVIKDPFRRIWLEHEAWRLAAEELFKSKLSINWQKFWRVRKLCWLTYRLEHPMPSVQLASKKEST